MKKKLISILISVTMLLSLAAPAMAAAPKFPDTAGHWGESSAQRWAEAGVLKGDQFGDFLPDKEMTRAEFAQMLCNLMGYTAKAKNTFADVSSRDWFADAVLKLSAAGVMQGDGANANPNAPITREQTAVMLCRAMDLKPVKGAAAADLSGVSSWARDAMTALSQRKMMIGNQHGNLMPTVNIDRASVAKLVDNMVSAYVNTNGATLTGDQSGIVIIAAKDVTIKDAKLSETVVVAPAASGTVKLTGKTQAADVLVASEDVKLVVDAAATAATVTVSADGAAAEIAGKAAAAVVTGDDANLTVARGGAVTAITVEGERADLTVSGRVDKVTVAGSADGASITVNKGATIAKVETAADNVSIGGSGRITTVTVTGGEGVEIAKGTASKVENKSDNTVSVGGKDLKPGKTQTTTTTSGGSSGSSTPSYDVTVTVRDSAGGVSTVTGELQQNGKAVEGETAPKYDAITIAPKANVQDGAVMPYIVKEAVLTTAPADSAAALTETDGVYTFTPDMRGSYVIDVTYVQPITQAELFVAATAADVTKMVSYGYPEGDVTGDILKDYPYLFLGMKPTEGFTPADPDRKTNVTLTADGARVAGAGCAWLKDGAFTAGKWAAAYIGDEKPESDPHDPADKLSYANASCGAFTLSFDYQGAHYELASGAYAQPGATAENTVTVAVQEKVGGAAAAVGTYTGQAGKTISIPAAVTGSVEKYHTGTAVKVGDAAETADTDAAGGAYTIPADATKDTVIVITHSYVSIGGQGVAVRLKGNSVSKTDGSFDYPAVYAAAGLTLEGTTYKVNGDKLVEFYEAHMDADGENYTDLTDLYRPDTTQIQFGIMYTKPEGANKAAEAYAIEDLYTAELQDLTVETINVYDGNLIDYFGAAEVKDGLVEFLPDMPAGDANGDTFIAWYKDTELLAVNFVNISRATTKPSDRTVTFVNGGETAAQTVAYGGLTEAPADPAKAGYAFDGWFAENADAPFDFTKPITANVTLTAKFAPIEFTVKLGGDEQIWTIEGKKDNDTIDETAKYTLPKVEPEEGKLFLGYFAATGGAAGPAELLSDGKADKDLTAAELFGYAIADENGDYAVTISAVTPVEAANVNASVAADSVPGKLGIEAGTYENGKLTYTVDKAKFLEEWAKLSAEEQNTVIHERKLYLRVNSDVPNGVDANTDWCGSVDGGETFKSSVKVTGETLNAVGIDVTLDGSDVKTIGQWFGMAEQNAEGASPELLVPGGKTWTVVYKWTNADGAVQATTFILERVVVEGGQTTQP